MNNGLMPYTTSISTYCHCNQLDFDSKFITKVLEPQAFMLTPWFISRKYKHAFAFVCVQMFACDFPDRHILGWPEHKGRWVDTDFHDAMTLV
jgi:hypothetical protein